MEIVIIALAVLGLIFILKRKKKTQFIPTPYSKEKKTYLHTHIEFYRELTDNNKLLFENRIQKFIHKIKVTGIDVDVDEYDRLLVASSAIIPVFAFPEWEYPGLKEVLLYPGSFNEKFVCAQPDSLISGMVGTGYMEGKMILSKPALHHGFSNAGDRKNVGIHEFVHLIDKVDGVVDGIPEVLVNKEFALPWLELVRQKMEKIHNLDSDINAYGGTDKREFFSVIAEYFFESPKLLKSKHPILYEQLNQIFTTDLANRYKGKNKGGEPGRNDRCPCGSGKKYKRCCGRV